MLRQVYKTPIWCVSTESQVHKICGSTTVSLVNTCALEDRTQLKVQ